jgi:LEA14-like dessication related protein
MNIASSSPPSGVPVTRRFPSRGSGPVRRWLLLVPFLLLIGGCSVFFRSPGVTLADVRVIGLGLTSGTAQITLEVENPNLFQLEVREFHYLLEVEGRHDTWSRLAEGSSVERIRLPRRSKEEVRLEVPFSYDAVGVALQSWWQTGSMNYRVRGDLTARGPTGRIDLPFRAEGSMSP